MRALFGAYMGITTKELNEGYWKLAVYILCILVIALVLYIRNIIAVDVVHGVASLLLLPIIGLLATMLKEKDE